MDVVATAKRIEQKISELVSARQGLDTLARGKALSAGRYAKRLAVVILQLRNGHKLSIDGIEITNAPVTLIEKLAKGICADEQVVMDEAEAKYKLAVTRLDCIRAELNGWQSINRHLDNE